MGFQRGQQTLVIILLVISGVTGRSSSFNIHVLFLVLPKADLRQGLECRSDSSNEGAGKVRQEKEASEGYVKESLWVTGAQIPGNSLRNCKNLY